MKFYNTLLLLLVLFLAGCASPAPTSPTNADGIVDMNTLPERVDANTLATIKERSEVFLLDVREQSEYDAAHIPGITLIPMGEVASRLSEIPQDKTVIVACQSGGRSSQIAKFLREQGYAHVHDLQGGIVAWEAAGLPVER